MTILAKVCGLVRAQDVVFAASEGADLLGFVSHRPSPRHCPNLHLASPFLDRAVLVQVADQPDVILATAQHFGFRNVQPYLPLEEREGGVKMLRNSGIFVLLPWADEAGQVPIPTDLYVWETSAAVSGMAGGSGQVHAMAFPPPGDFLLAGGLDAWNLQERVRSIPASLRVHFRGADAASRLESSPGVKDAAKVTAFIRMAHELESA